MRTVIFLLIPCLVNDHYVEAQALAGQTSADKSDAVGLSKAEQAAIKSQFELVLQATPIDSAESTVTTSVHSKRGDALFFLRRFDECVLEYEAMVKLNPQLDESHWRLGIALFFADKPKQAVAQFEKYHSYDDVDRENGIWRYLSQYKATDGKKAARELIRYAKDDREPFPMVYRLFDGSVSPDEALNSIPKNLPDAELDKRLFYTELYIGMHCIVKKQPQLAKKYLARSVSRKWPRTAGYGPAYMWHVARVQLDLLRDSDSQVEDLTTPAENSSK